jgi:hypothetical protein
MSGYSLNLHGSVNVGGRTDNVDHVLTNWRRSIRRVGGFWSGTADFVGTRAEMRDMYLTGMMRRLTESAGGLVTWEGFIGQMDFTLDGVTYTRSMLEVANAIKTTYTKIGTNLLSNGDVETSAWAAEGSPTTNERSTTWIAGGTYSMHCVTRSSENSEGMEIDNTITIEAETAYQCRVTVNNVQGTWVLKIKDQTTDATLGKAKYADTGEGTIIANLPEDNTSTSVRIILIEKTTGTSGEIYADNAWFGIAPTKAETTWYTDAASITDYGRIEDNLLEGEMTEDAADAKCQKELERRAWPRSLPPEQMESGAVKAAKATRDGLKILFLGYVFTLNWEYLASGGEFAANTAISNIVGDSTYVTAGAIDTNSMTVLIEEIYPMRAWDMVEDIMLSGDATNARWQGGVYAGRLFNYEAADTTVRYHYNNGQLYHVNYAPVAPWKARPGLARIDDMPVGPGQITGRDADDPRNVFLDEVEFIAPDGLAFKRETRMGR